MFNLLDRTGRGNLYALGVQNTFYQCTGTSTSHPEGEKELHKPNINKAAHLMRTRGGSHVTAAVRHGDHLHVAGTSVNKHPYEINKVSEERYLAIHKIDVRYDVSQPK